MSVNESQPVQSAPKKTTYEEAVARLRREYSRMLELWESGQIFYHFKAFIKKYARVGWVRYDLIKEPLCAVLALSRFGFPVSTASVSFLLVSNGVGSGGAKAKAEAVAYQKLMYLASYGMLEPVGVQKTETGTSVRVFKLTPPFIKVIYRPLKELEEKEENHSGI